MCAHLSFPLNVPGLSLPTLPCSARQNGTESTVMTSTASGYNMTSFYEAPSDAIENRFIIQARYSAALHRIGPGSGRACAPVLRHAALRGPPLATARAARRIRRRTQS